MDHVCLREIKKKTTNTDKAILSILYRYGIYKIKYKNMGLKQPKLMKIVFYG